MISGKTFLLCLLLLFSVQSLQLWSQDMPGIYGNLDALESLIEDTLLQSETQLTQLEALNKILSENEQTIASNERLLSGQEKLLGDLRKQLNSMSEIYTKQSDLSAKYERSSAFWKKFTLIGLPVTALISGGLTALLLSSR